MFACLFVFRRPFVKRFAVCYRTVTCPVLTVCMSVGPNIGVLWPNGWMDQDETWGRPRRWPHCIDEDPAPKKGDSWLPIFGRCLLWPNCLMDQDATWYGGRPRPWLHCVRWGSSSPQKGPKPPATPIFGPCLLWTDGWMDQDVTWYFGREVGLGPSDIGSLYLLLKPKSKNLV